MNKMNEKLFTNLKIISKIKINDKIYVNNDKFVIVEHNNWWLSIVRAVYREDRNKNILQLKEIYNDIFAYINNRLHSKFLINNKNLSELEYEAHLELCNSLKHIAQELTLSKIGLNNLKKTYNNDMLVDSKLDNIINSVDHILIKIKEKVLIDDIDYENSNNFMNDIDKEMNETIHT